MKFHLLKLFKFDIPEIKIPNSSLLVENKDVLINKVNILLNKPLLGCSVAISDKIRANSKISEAPKIQA